MSLAKNLAQTLSEKGLNARQLQAIIEARGGKIAHTYICKILRGEVRRAGYEKLMLIARALRVPVERLVGPEDIDGIQLSRHAQQVIELWSTMDLLERSTVMRLLDRLAQGTPKCTKV